MNDKTIDLNENSKMGDCYELKAEKFSCIEKERNVYSDLIKDMVSILKMAQEDLNKITGDDGNLTSLQQLIDYGGCP